MQRTTLSFTTSTGWSQPFPSELDSEHTLLIVFGASHFYEQTPVFAELRNAFPQAHVLGCSTSGEIYNSTVNDDSLVVGIVRFERSHIMSTHTGISDASQSYTAGQALAAQLQAPDLRAVFVLSDGIHVNGSELVRGITANLAAHVIVTGGLAGDGVNFQRTWVLYNGMPHSDMISAVGFYGEHIQIGHGSKGGWDVLGHERVVTRSQNNILYELDGKSALQLYKDYLGDMAAGLPSTGLFFPLSLYSGTEGEEPLIRTILAVDEATQSLTFAGDIPQGAHVQLMRANFDRLIDGAEGAAILARGQSHSHLPSLCIAISCVGRRLVLRDRSEEEVESTLAVLGEETQQIGFYSYGEISPSSSSVSPNASCELHNQTMTLTTITEY